ncbi:hypothetical protein X777_14040 [Ooceraea biroi]|uniref:Uncharacterized protein n=1 Tax=Ooceraea biroi TaxID=2015173 RepID=A0A026VX01_OOCBI|nr:hypothetical protein X777_14040 [Ooceraea biroi]
MSAEYDLRSVSSTALSWMGNSRGINRVILEFFTVEKRMRQETNRRARARGNARITYPVHAPWNFSYLPLETRISVSVTHLSRFQSPTPGTNLTPES